MLYQVTTHASQIPKDHQIIMVDGTVPGWQPHPSDQHWDHHRTNGAAIQIDEMPAPIDQPIIQAIANGQPQTIVTTQLDADACCAAAWVQLPASALTPATVNKLRAIAWDCDHLVVPNALAPLAEFAAQAVATLDQQPLQIAQALHLPLPKQQWTPAQTAQIDAQAFQLNTEWLMDAVLGQRPFPGEQGEANHLGHQILADAQHLLRDHRVQLMHPAQSKTLAIAVFDLRGMTQSISPKAALKALDLISSPTLLQAQTLTCKDHRRGGTQYTLGCIPLHPETEHLDYTTHTFAALTLAEQQMNPLADPWGGRRSVGGSGWNTPSGLTPQQVIDIAWFSIHEA